MLSRTRRRHCRRLFDQRGNVVDTLENDRVSAGEHEFRARTTLDRLHIVMIESFTAQRKLRSKVDKRVTCPDLGRFS